MEMRRARVARRLRLVQGEQNEASVLAIEADLNGGIVAEVLRRMAGRVRKLGVELGDVDVDVDGLAVAVALHRDVHVARSLAHRHALNRDRQPLAIGDVDLAVRRDQAETIELGVALCLHSAREPARAHLLDANGAPRLDVDPRVHVVEFLAERGKLHRSVGELHRAVHRSIGEPLADMDSRAGVDSAIEIVERVANERQERGRTEVVREHGRLDALGLVELGNDLGAPGHSPGDRRVEVAIGAGERHRCIELAILNAGDDLRFFEVDVVELHLRDVEVCVEARVLVEIVQGHGAVEPPCHFGVGDVGDRLQGEALEMHFGARAPRRRGTLCEERVDRRVDLRRRIEHDSLGPAHLEVRVTDLGVVLGRHIEIDGKRRARRRRLNAASDGVQREERRPCRSGEIRSEPHRPTQLRWARHLGILVERAQRHVEVRQDGHRLEQRARSLRMPLHLRQRQIGFRAQCREGASAVDYSSRDVGATAHARDARVEQHVDSLDAPRK